MLFVFIKDWNFIQAKESTIDPDSFKPRSFDFGEGIFMGSFFILNQRGKDVQFRLQRQLRDDLNDLRDGKRQNWFMMRRAIRNPNPGIQ